MASQIKIGRRIRTVSVVLSTSTSIATTFRLDEMAGGILHMGTASTNSSALQTFVAQGGTATFARLYDSGGTAADISISASTSQARSYSLPDAVFGAEYAKIVAGSTHVEGYPAVVVLKS